MNHDPLRDAASHVVRIPLLGVESTFVSDSPAILDAIRRNWGAWSELDDQTGIISPSPATVRILVDETRRGNAAPSAFSYHMPDPTRMIVEWDGGSGVADTLRLESVAHVPVDLVARPAELIDGVIEPLTLFLLGALDREPLHAAAIARANAAILLAAPSGTGKSTLAYAAWRHGYDLLADEPVYVQSHPTFRLWGRRARVHLMQDARDHFPELRDTPLTRLPGGKTKMVVQLHERVRRFADHAGICLLSRDGAGPDLERIEPAQVVAELASDLDPGFDLFAATLPQRLERVAARGAWRLQLGPSPTDALPLLDEVAARLESGL